MSDTTSTPAITVLEYRPHEKNTLRGFVVLELASGLVLKSCTHHVKNDSAWVGLPATKTAADKWVAVVEIPDKDRRDKFNEVAIDEYLAAQK